MWGDPMSRGYVYILTNPSMPGLVKIGMTTRCVNGRAQELYQTGVPMPFKVSFEVLTPDCAELEIRAHEKFASVRVSDSREFFAASVADVSQYLEDELRYQVECLVDEFMPDHYVVPVDDFVDMGAFKASFYQAVTDSDLYHPDIVQALYQIEGHELAPALARTKAETDRRIAERRASKDAGQSTL